MTDRLIDLNSDPNSKNENDLLIMRSPPSQNHLEDRHPTSSSLDSLDSDQSRNNGESQHDSTITPVNTNGTNNGKDPTDQDDPYKYVDVSPLMSSARRNIRSAYFNGNNENKMLQSKSVNNLNDYYDASHPQSSTEMSKHHLLHAKETSLSIAHLDQMNPLMSILNNQELLQFATAIVPKNKIYQCTIIRDKKGIDRSFYPTYYMHLQGKQSRSRWKSTNQLN